MNEYLEKAARRLVDGFISLEHDDVATRFDRCGDENYAMPMWGTIFEVTDSRDIRAIRKLETTPLESIETMVRHAADHGFDFDVMGFVEVDSDDEDRCDDAEYHCGRCRPTYRLDSDSVICETCNRGLDFYLDTDAADEAWLDAWRDADPDGAALYEAGWRDVADTGVLMLSGPDGGLYLGLDGAGYSFYSDHWIPLYLAMGYSWHGQMEREDRIRKAASAVYCALDTDTLPDALELLRRAFE